MEQVNPNKAFLEVNACPVCNASKEISRKYLINYYSSKILEFNSIQDAPYITLLKCSHCNHHFPSYIIRPETLDSYYSAISAEMYLDKDKCPTDGLKKKHIALAKKIEKLYPNGGKIVDIGCGYGFLLSYLDQERWQCYGIEPSSIASEIAQNNGVEIIGKFLNVRSTNEKFDTIVMLDVIEHLSSPNSMIEEITDLLKENGTLIIGTGNINSLNARLGASKWSYFCSYEHISFFTPSSIKKLLSKHQFKSIRIKRASHRSECALNTYTLLKNLIKIVLFKFLGLKKDYSIHLTFDHILVFAKINK